MADALHSLAPPPVPNPDQQQGALTGGASSQAPAGPGAAPQPAQPIPAPTHNQTVATLRHFAAIGKELEIVGKDPDLGKSDIKDKIIDAVTRLVADRIISPGQAVQQLSTFPDRPFEQKQWVAQHLQQTLQARNMVLDHYRASAQPTPQIPPTPSAETHMQDVSGMMSAHYKPQTVH